MYEPEELMSDDALSKVQITPEVKALTDIFSRKMDFNLISNKGSRILKTAGCETVGDVFYFMLDHRFELGRKTAEDILFRLIESIIPCCTAVECEKAFLLSQSGEEITTEIPNRGITDYELMLFRFSTKNIRRSTGTLAEILHMDRKEFEAAVMRGMEKEREMLEIKAAKLQLDKLL